MKEFLQLILGFIPWLLFMFISGHSLYQLEVAILICLAASVVFGLRDLPKDRWHDVHVVRVCMVIAVVWACLMTVSAVMSAVPKNI